jgi:hypothetical protein|tara:strand:+ start:302 stop:424 length:123 start_codon:yes stop_codon:yes gene_type:complete
MRYQEKEAKSFILEYGNWIIAILILIAIYVYVSGVWGFLS